MNRIRVGILGATGAVGQQFVHLLENHPWFEITALAASERSAGRRYGEIVNWIGGGEPPKSVADMVVQEAKPPLPCDLVFSGMDASVAGEIETAFAEAGIAVLSNARNHRMRADVPLLIPEVNPDHIGLISGQAYPEGGMIVTNPNCATVGLVCTLKPLVDAFGVTGVQATTMQAVSGAGYPGVPSLDILGNVIPFISGEEAKVETEPRKILGHFDGTAVQPLEAVISAQCNRVAVLDGHMVSASVSLGRRVAIEEVVAALREFRSPLEGLGLPSAPERFLDVYDEGPAPQPRRHAWSGRGMTVSVGRIRTCPVADVRFVALVHNTVRGAAGGAILNAELLVRQGLVKAAPPGSGPRNRS